ncbi:MAG TPA: Trk system potassium transporter TrkA, partial [Ruminococcus sp.]|nr:Trk system potassium transporter TrkA [Ruminococcus sp.]
VLMEAGADAADILIAAAAADEINIYTCLMAKAAGVKHTIARVRNPEYTQDLFRVKDQLGLSMAINPELTAAIEISRLLRFSGALEI